jgi:creatinine amidohydrolase/Fe(II)-dependent formamide hydrolase-like protein
MTLVPARRGSDGVQGDPRRSSAAVGGLGVELIVARTVAAIRRSAIRP